MRSRRLTTVSVSAAVAAALALSACGGGEEHSASDKASGMTVAIKGDEVTLKRTGKSESGTGGKAGQVSCTVDYAKLAKASELPNPDTDWYAATLITWPDKGKETSARLSHELEGKPDLCIAQASDSSSSVVVYFDSKVKAGVEKIQDDQARTQQAEQAEAALQSASQMAVSVVADKKFPAVDTVVTSLTGQGLIAKKAATSDAVTETGTVYVVMDETSDKQVVLAIKGKDGKVTTATQKTTGSPKISTAK